MLGPEMAPTTARSPSVSVRTWDISRPLSGSSPLAALSTSGGSPPFLVWVRRMPESALAVVSIALQGTAMITIGTL